MCPACVRSITLEQCLSSSSEGTWVRAMTGAGAEKEVTSAHIEKRRQCKQQMCFKKQSNTCASKRNLCACRHWKWHMEVKKGPDLYKETRKENLKNNDGLEDRDGGIEKGAREPDRGEAGKTREPAGQGGGERNNPTGSRTEK